MNPANTFEVKIAGSPLPPAVKNLLVSAYVDQSLNVPDMFVLTFRDPDRTVLSQSHIEIGSSVGISIVSDADPSGQRLLAEAEVTALEVEYDPSGTTTIVRGFDKTHRLFRGSHTESYVNSSYSDIASQIASRNGLSTGQIDSTSVVHDVVSQPNTSDWQFLVGLAREVGYEVAAESGKLDFRKPVAASGASEPGDMQSQDPTQLVTGKNLLSVRCSVTAGEQVTKVDVQSWDPKQKKGLHASAEAATTAADLELTPKGLAALFGTPVSLAVDIPFGNADECQAAASAIANEIGGAFASLDGVANGDIKLKAGGLVSLGLAGKPFDGKYRLTSARHHFDPAEGYTTWFTVSGSHERSLYGLASGARTNGGVSPAPAGVVPAIVTNIKDPDDIARVKVKFPWLSDAYESDWARTVQASAGNGYGAVYVPEVGDEVLVAFDHGDLRRGFVLGGLYNGQDKPPAGGVDLIDSSGKANRRDLVSRTGHTISMMEKEGGNDAILIKTSDGKYVLQLDKHNKKITISADGAIEIDATGSPGTVTIKAQGNMDLQGQQISMKAQSGVSIDGGQGNVDVKGMAISAQAQTSAELKGLTVSVSGDTTAELKGGAEVTVQGAIVQIN